MILFGEDRFVRVCNVGNSLEIENEKVDLVIRFFDSSTVWR